MGFLELWIGSNRGAPVTEDNPIPVAVVSGGGGGGAGTSDTTEATQLLVKTAAEAIQSNTADGNVSLASVDGKLTTVIGHVDGLETLVTSLNTKIDALNGYASDTATIGVAQDTAVLKNAATSLTPKFAAIAASSSGNNTLIVAVTSKKIRVLAYNLIGNGAVNAKFQSGASGTDLTGLKYIAAAGGGICAPFNPLGWFETASNTLLNLNLSGAVAVGGEIVYVEV